MTYPVDVVGGEATDGASLHDVVELDEGPKLGYIHEVLVQHFNTNAGKSFGEVLHLCIPWMLD